MRGEGCGGGVGDRGGVLILVDGGGRFVLGEWDIEVARLLRWYDYPGYM